MRRRCFLLAMVFLGVVGANPAIGQEGLIRKAELKDELWKLRMLVIATLVAMVALNPKVLELVGRVLGMGK